ncbi:chromosome segregation protein [Haloferula luteola]|uniref:Chromosome partition protein Smc n=1 Tax=Haloferula luteola TaxID=595692 RepID=A0A840VE97_9BACT|nr:chromosome segregation protein SMC [Haloferula luteola]MBB5351161.1 chromosome segregation protein [Haloferula luteola]
MYLKSLDIHGFKSFADKTRLEFHQGVTGIVGPNGCGKSNVVDAIRWVLGETSAKALRGGEMADVIFNGTERRKPLGMAEVTLTMADCEGSLGVDYNEVAITRRVFRDGKSEYRINGTLCRLKDIHDLFMDTGIGRTAYSIMAQGQIDQILSSKPEERRAVFEEAAGITKYKREKKDALRKLDYTEANLLRVSDVLAEQERRMNSLKRQVAKARRYQTLANDVRVLDTHLGHKKFVEMSAAAAELRTSIRSLEITEGDLERKMAPKEEAVAGAREAARSFEGLLAERRQELNEHRNALASAEGRIAFNMERRAELEGRIEQNKAEIDATQEKLAQQEFDVVAANEALEALVRRIAEMEISLSQQEEQTASARARRETLEAAQRESRSEANRTQTVIATMQAKIESSLAQLETSRERSRQLADEEQRLHNELEEAMMQRDQIVQELDEHARRTQELEENLQRAERQYQHVRGDLDAARTAAAEAHKVLAQRSSRLEVLRQLVASGEGFEQGTRKVLEGLGEPERFRSGVHGVLAGFIEAEKECARALEAALGGHLQAVLVEDAALAEAVIARLTEKKLGQAKILPREFVTASNGTQIETIPGGAIAWALDRVKIDEKVRSVVERLLERVLIVPDLATGMRLRKDFPDVSMATLAGEWIGAEGIVFGGAAGDGAVSVLERQNEVRELETEVAALTESEAQAKARVEHLEAELSRLQEEHEVARDRVQRHKVELSTLEGQRSLAVREVEAVETKLENVRWERGDLDQREAATQENRGAMEAELSAARERLHACESDQSRLNTELEDSRRDEAELAEALNEVRTSIAVERRAKEAQEAQQQPMEARLAELREIAVRRETEIGAFMQRIEAATGENAALAEEVEQHRCEAEDLEVDIQERMGQRNELIESIEIAERELTEVRKGHARAAEQRGREEVALTKIELRLESLVNAILERHNLELAHFEPDAHALLSCIATQKSNGRGRTSVVESSEDGEDGEDADEVAVTVVDGTADEVELPPLMEGEPDWDFVESCVGDLKRRLDSMGPVNLDAIEEYEELEARHNDVRSNYEDLVSSKEELLQVIEKINEETKRRFSETFAQVKTNFRDMFKELFGEQGKADLQLVDEEDPLESGIEVIAKPPGKKLQSITLLSGGERSMTAVALLFSIYMIKPSPFCVLDELDAPLDESNIGRFVKVLDRFVNNSQFIIVTHSKRTMGRADVMYGVTMEEFGVSKPVGMRLTTADQQTPKGEAKTAAQRAALRLDA